MHRIIALIAVLAVGCGHPGDRKDKKVDEVVPDDVAAPAVVEDDGLALEEQEGIEEVVDDDVGDVDPSCINVCELYKDRACFDLVAEKNISHVFIDFGDCDIGDFRVFALTPFNDDFEEITDLEVTNLRDQGGPCHEIERDYVFGLPGPERDEPGEAYHAKVCILFQDKFGEVRVGFHAGEVCEPGETKLSGFCLPCDLGGLRK